MRVRVRVWVHVRVIVGVWVRVRVRVRTRVRVWVGLELRVKVRFGEGPGFGFGVRDRLWEAGVPIDDAAHRGRVEKGHRGPQNGLEGAIVHTARRIETRLGPPTP